MKILHNFREYIDSKQFVINIYKDNINILNYTKIGVVDSNQISVIDGKNTVVIKGTNLALKKMLEGEILVSGVIKNIEFR
jgi:hypothetical protein